MRYQSFQSPIVIACLVSALLLLYTLWQIQQHAQNIKWLNVENLSGKKPSIKIHVENPTYLNLELARGGKVLSTNRAKYIQSISNPHGFMNLIDPFAGDMFNPTVLVFPRKMETAYRYLMVSRGKEVYEVIDGDDTRWQTVLGCFLRITKREVGHPLMERSSELTTLNLPAERKPPYQRCEEHTYDQFIGPEDPRLFFTSDNQPLLIYSQTGQSPMICRALFIIDARAVVPGLKDAMARAGLNPPMNFPVQKDLIRTDQYNIEKNWSPFVGSDGALYFHVDLLPQKIYRYTPQLILKPLEDIDNSKVNCLSRVIGADPAHTKLHHATPLVSVTLCKRGECEPNNENTVLFGFIHVKYFPDPFLFYERRVVTWNITSPYNYISVSKPIMFSGVNQGDPVFTVSTNWADPSTAPYNHGYLDDPLITSFGVFDYGSAYIDHFADDVLTEHTLCDAYGIDSKSPLHILTKAKE